MFFFFFLSIDLHFLIPAVITETFNPITELVIPIGIPTKEAQSEMETYLLTVEINISASCSLMNFDLFLQLDSFLFHLYLV